MLWDAVAGITPSVAGETLAVKRRAGAVVQAFRQHAPPPVWRAAPPTFGPFRPGDLVWNSAAAAGEPAGWLCQGEPCTWLGIGSVSP
jgi:hypothetical protein